MYEITVKWPDGRVITDDGYSDDQAHALADVFWSAGADDVTIRCSCGYCETCADRAAWSDQ